MVRFVRRGKRFGLVNDKQRVVVPFVFDRIEPFIDGFGVGSIDRFGDYLYDESGKMMFGQPFDTITRRGLSQDEAFAWDRNVHYVIRHKGRSCVLDRNLEVLVPWGEYKIPSGPSEGIWILRDDRDRFGYAGMGRVISPCRYLDASSFCNGYASVRWRDRKWGMIDARGNLVIPDIYDSIDVFSEGLVGAVKDGFSGFLDQNGRVAIPFMFESAEAFRHGMASVVTSDGDCRKIDHSGRFVDDLATCEVPEDLRGKRIAPKKGREIAKYRKKLRRWFNGLEGAEFVTRKKSDIGYLVWYAAPYTGSGSECVPKGVRFVAYSKMRDDAWYCECKDDSIEKLVYRKERKKSYKWPGLAGRCSGISFFITEEQLSGKAFEEVAKGRK